MAKLRFRFLIVDDEHANVPPWARFLPLLVGRRYFSDSMKKAWTACTTKRLQRPFKHRDLSLHFKVICSANSNFDTGLEAFKKEISRPDIDFVVLDLQFKDNRMDPTYNENGARTNRSLIANEYQDSDRQPLDEIPGDRSRYIAGLAFLRENWLRLSCSRTPVVVYSASDKTEEVRRALRLLPVFPWITIVDVSPTTAFNESSQVGEAFRTIDSRLTEEQRRVLLVQKSQFLIDLKGRAEKGDSDQLKIFDIEDPKRNGSWSLWTLFPQQVNGILRSRGQNRVESRTKLSRLLTVSDWRTLMVGKPDVSGSGLFNHPGSNGFPARFFDKIRECEFTASGNASSYQKVTGDASFPGPEADPVWSRLQDLRDRLLCRSSPVNGIAVGLFIEQQINPNEDEISPTTKSLLTNVGRTFGLAATDLAFLAQIAISNKRHTDSRIQPTLAISNLDGSCRLEWTYPGAAHEGRIVGAAEVIRACYGLDADELMVLRRDGFEEFFKIACVRYKGTIELLSGSESLTANCREFTYKSPAPAVDGTKLIVSIGKP